MKKIDNIKCLNCGISFTPTIPNIQKYCLDCGPKVYYNNRRKFRKKGAVLRCLMCEKIITKPKATRYCSDRCYKWACYLKRQEYRLNAKKKEELKRQDRNLLKRIGRRLNDA